MSVNGMVIRVGQTLGPLAAAFFFVLGGLPGAFLSGAGIALIMLSLAFFLVPDQKEPPGDLSAGKA